MKKNNSLIIEDFVKSFYVKSLVEYNIEDDISLPKRGLSFNPGDILLVLNANDEHWWSGRSLDYTSALSSSSNINNSSSQQQFVPCLSPYEGLIPSAEKLARRYRNKDISVNFHTDTTVIEPNGTLSSNKTADSEFPAGATSTEVKNKRKQAYYQRLMKDKLPSPTTDCANITAQDVYQIVQPQKINYPRPIIIIGPGKSRVYDYLINKFPKMFASPVNHTSRPKRPNEIDGVDYHFVVSKEAFEKDREAGYFLESVQFKNNWYGTSKQSVQQVIDSGRHCILDATISIIDNCIEADFQPICLLICCASYETAKLLYGPEPNEKILKNIMQNALNHNVRDRLQFDAVLWSMSVEQLYSQVYNCIANCQRMGIFTALPDQTQLE